MSCFYNDFEIMFNDHNVNGIGEVAFTYSSWSTHKKILMMLNKQAGSLILDQISVNSRSCQEIKMSSSLIAITTGFSQS